jgi:putative tryptophan/tyrosine transport system substrate-binding protein
MRRRRFITLLGGAAAWPLAARAQSSPMRRVGVLNPFAENDPEYANVAAFRQALEKLGWTNGGNVRIDYRWGGADPARIRAQAKEIVAFKPDVILVSTALALQPLLQETRSIPMVVARIVDPVGAGFVASLARPGGNLTGFTAGEFSLFGKLVEVLKEIAPQVTRVAVLHHPDQVPQTHMLRAVEAAAKSIGVQVTAAGARDLAAVERAVNEFAREPGGGLIVFPNAVTEGNREPIIAIAAQHRLPAAYGYRFFVADGGLISYGVDLADQYRQAASYVDRILRGEKPADLPVQQPTKFELVLNLKTAKALGLDVPLFFQQRADEVIEQDTFLLHLLASARGTSRRIGVP